MRPFPGAAPNWQEAGSAAAPLSRLLYCVAGPWVRTEPKVKSSYQNTGVSTRTLLFMHGILRRSLLIALANVSRFTRPRCPCFVSRTEVSCRTTKFQMDYYTNAVVDKTACKHCGRGNLRSPSSLLTPARPKRRPPKRLPASSSLLLPRSVASFPQHRQRGARACTRFLARLQRPLPQAIVGHGTTMRLNLDMIKPDALSRLDHVASGLLGRGACRACAPRSGNGA